MEDVTLSEAKEKLEDLIARAGRGEEVRITDPKLGTVRLQHVGKPDDVAAERERIPGRWKGRLTVPARLFEPLSEEEMRWLSGEAST